MKKQSTWSPFRHLRPSTDKARRSPFLRRIGGVLYIEDHPKWAKRIDHSD
jgi:hypothetical protein